jgi:virulence-associated protein VagC
MVKKEYGPYRKISIYEQGANRTMEPLEEAKADAQKVEASKNKWSKMQKERKGSPNMQTGRNQKTRTQIFKKSDR